MAPSVSAACNILLIVDNLLNLFSCLAHIINLATQALISTRSKAKYYNPHDNEIHETPNMDAEPGHQRDEVGLIRAICVKVHRSFLKSEYANNRIILGSFICSTQRTFQENTTEQQRITTPASP